MSEREVFHQLEPEIYLKFSKNETRQTIAFFIWCMFAFDIVNADTLNHLFDQRWHMLAVKIMQCIAKIIARLNIDFFNQENPKSW